MVSPEQLQVIVLAAGKGVRMRSETPKVLHRVCGLTLVERVMRAAEEIGCKKFIVVVGSGREAVSAEVERLKGTSRFRGKTAETVVQAEQ